MARLHSLGFGLLTAIGTVLPVVAQRPAPPPAVSPVVVQQAPAPQAPPAPAPPAWDSFPTMVLERVYRGPLRDTVVQRFRDVVDGTVCFLYIPISAPLLAQQPGSAYVQYGANTIGSISCTHPTQVVQIIREPLPQVARAAAPAPAPAAPRPSRPNPGR